MSPKSRSRLWRSTAKRISSFSTYQDLPGNGRLSRGTRGTRRAAQPPPPHSFVRKSGPGRRPCDEQQVDLKWIPSTGNAVNHQVCKAFSEQRKLVGNEQSSTYPHSIEVSGANQIQHKPWGRMRRQSCSLFFTLEAVWTTECLHLRVKAQVYTCTTSMMLQIMWQHCQRHEYHECTLIMAIYGNVTANLIAPVAGKWSRLLYICSVFCTDFHNLHIEPGSNSGLIPSCTNGSALLATLWICRCFVLGAKGWDSGSTCWRWWEDAAICISKYVHVGVGVYIYNTL